MSYQNENAMTEMNHFTLPAMAEGDFSSEELAEDMDGLQLNFQRVKIPSGGALQFEIPGDDPENPDYARYLEGVILYNHASGAYWPADSEYDENTAPLCSSVDGKMGIGEPGGACETCSLNRFGTAPDGRGKACKNMRVLYLLRDGEFMPLQVSLSPTSIKPFRDFINAAFVTRRRGTCGSVIQIGLKRANNGKDEYSVATFRKLYDFTGQELSQIKAYADGFREQVKLALQQRAAATEDQLDDGCDYSGYDQPVQETDGHFCIAHQIDGDREDLPA
ncbi:MAG: Tsac [Oscillospiraceae bacterium]|nr:Tsac [Oscillospiraceae bacterium]